MLSLLRDAKHVLRTTESRIEILSFNSRNEPIGRFPYTSRQAAIGALMSMTGRRVRLAPMQTVGAELLMPDAPAEESED